MANYYATTRSNYFRVKDTAAFEAWCADNSLEHWTDTKDGDTYHAISADTGDSGGWPSQRYEEDDDGAGDYVDINFDAELADFLDPRDVAILLEVGSEKLRYLVGVAVAIHPDGRTHHLNIGSIYDEARKAFKDDAIQITDAMY